MSQENRRGLKFDFWNKKFKMVFQTTAEQSGVAKKGGLIVYDHHIKLLATTMYYSKA
jgi:hypothetical protein